jgi:hypothetical protein
MYNVHILSEPKVFGDLAAIITGPLPKMSQKCYRLSQLDQVYVILKNYEG